MSIEKMKLVKVTGNLNKMNAALTTCFEGGFFHMFRKKQEPMVIIRSML